MYGVSEGRVERQETGGSDANQDKDAPAGCLLWSRVSRESLTSFPHLVPHTALFRAPSYWHQRRAHRMRQQTAESEAIMWYSNEDELMTGVYVTGLTTAAAPVLLC